ncbi:MAG: CYTH domain-containing protein [Trueperaceae bacterium]|nr:CYTH domain-containing protein [Trueperaceae bacterium]
MTPSAPVERELKYSLVDAPPPPAVVVALGRQGPYAFAEAGTTVHRDRYYDGAAGQLRRAGWALRQRRTLAPDAGDGPTVVATLKGAGRVDGAMHEREEIEAAMEGRAWPLPIARLVAVHVSLRDLRPRLTLETERAAYRVTREGRPAALLAFDQVRVRIPGGERSAHFDEVEIEAIGGTTGPELQGIVDLLDALVRLTPSSASKLERAAALLELGTSL